MKNTKADDKKYIGNTFKRYDVVFEKGQGATLTDAGGKQYVDFFSGIAVNALGHNNAAVIKAINTQAKKIIHLSNLFYMKTQVKLAKILVENSFGDKVFFVNSGAEANEVALKIARKWGIIKKNGANKVISFYNSFHGRTVTTLTATGQEKFHKYLNPPAPGFEYAKFGDIEDVKRKIDEKTCAVLVEPVQAEGGIIVPPTDFLKKLKTLCKEKNVLLIFDEVQTGLGRTGKLFGYEYFNAVPDIMTLGKALGGGLPLSAVIIAKGISEVFTFGDHGTTMGGNPVACAAGEVLLKKIKSPAFLKQVNKKSEYIMKSIKKMKSYNIKEVRGTGLLIGVEVKDKGDAIVAEALKQGLIIGSAGMNVIRITPPLTITKAEMDKGLEVLKKVLG
ncbi:MAG: aspartate aminotransferase family protein [bacterium]